MSYKLPALFLMTIVPMLGACSNMRHYEWTEDVQLSDGKMVVVQRSEDYRQVTDIGAGFQTGPLFQKATISAQLPRSSARRIEWTGSLSPIVLDELPGGDIYLIGHAMTGAGQNEWNLGWHGVYVAFRLTDDRWVRVPIEQIPESVQPNLLPNGYDLFFKRKAESGVHVDLQVKKDLISTIPEKNTQRTIIHKRAK